MRQATQLAVAFETSFGEACVGVSVSIGVIDMRVSLTCLQRRGSRFALGAMPCYFHPSCFGKGFLGTSSEHQGPCPSAANWQVQRRDAGCAKTAWM